MFRRAAIFCLGGLFLCSLIWILQFCVVRKSDYAFYKEAHVQKQQIYSSEKKEMLAHQKRSGVTKDIWRIQDTGERMHSHIESKGSLVTFVPTNNKIDIIENLSDLKCWMQEKLSDPQNPMQQIRYFEAKEGTYHLLTQKFVADNAYLALHRVPGHDLPIKTKLPIPFLKGIAQDVSVSLSGKGPQFQAHKFQATLQPSEAKQ